MRCSRHIADAAELAGQQPVLRIGEFGLHFQRAGPRVHLVQSVFSILPVCGNTELSARISCRGMRRSLSDPALLSS